MVEAEIFKVFLLAMARFAGLIVTAPVLGSANFPPQAKAGLAAMCAMIVTPWVPVAAAPLPDTPVSLGLLAAAEMILGFIMGFAITLVFAAVQVAGQIMDMLTGFGLVNVFNPALETQAPIFGFFFFILAALFLIAIDGHHLMLQGAANSFERFPLGGAAVEPRMLWDFTVLGRYMFSDGLVIAAPVAGSMLLAYVTMGIMGRLVPQIHLFVVGFPITIAVGLFMVALVIRVYLSLLDGLFGQMFRAVSGLLQEAG